MEQPDFQTGNFSACRIAIWGLGLIGGSLASGLKGNCAGIVGIDKNKDVIDFALSNGIVQRGSTNPKDVLENIDIIFLSTPVRTILGILDELPELCHEPVMVIDLGSTKQDIIQKMMDLPERFDTLGGHPMCGKEKGTIWNADPSIFRGATIAFTKTPRSSQRAEMLAGQIARLLGSVPLWLDAATHDRWVSATSHVPYLLANALVQATPVEAKSLIGPGFRSTARLSGNPAGMMVDILATNRDNIIQALKQVQEHLLFFETMIEQAEFEKLAHELEMNAQRYRDIIQEGP